MIRLSQVTASYFVPLHMHRNSARAIQPVQISPALRHVKTGKHLQSVQQFLHRLPTVLILLRIDDKLPFNTHPRMSRQLALVSSLTHLIRGYSQSQTDTIQNLHTSSFYYELFIKVLSTYCHCDHSLTSAAWPSY